MYKIVPVKKVRKEIVVSSDKSISHRALLISSLAAGKTKIINFLNSKDTLTTLNCLRNLNVDLDYKKNQKIVIIKSKGKMFKVKNKVTLFCGESGTTIRLMSGILAGQKFASFLTAGKSLSKRPMGRITHPLGMMGADIKGRKVGGEEYPPLRIKPVDKLGGITYTMPQASAQVKSAIIFASQFSEGLTRIKEPAPSRDHTERMLNFFGGEVKREGGYIVSKAWELEGGKEIFIPGDFSSASFFLALGVLVKDSAILLKNVGINPTRIGFLNTLKRMGGKIKILNKQDYFEPYGDILVKSSSLKGVRIESKDIPLMIDEIPILIVCACYAEGITEICGLKELRVKETDRINSMVTNLKRAGIDIQVRSYGKNKDWMLKIKGAKSVKPTSFESFSDHRTAMSLIIFGMASSETFYLDETECIEKSFPEFLKIVDSLDE